MEVIKRNGAKESMSFDKITKRISNMIEGRMGDGIIISPLRGHGNYKIDPIMVAKGCIVEGSFLFDVSNDGRIL